MSGSLAPVQHQTGPLYVRVNPLEESMRTLLALLLLVASPAFSADSNFNGRWDITTVGEGRPRAWWVELTGVGAATPSGKFVSVYAGDMNVIDRISVENGDLVFVINPKAGPRAKKQPPSRIYRAKLVNDKLDGTVMNEGQTQPPVKWKGVRAPVINEKDDGTWKEGAPIALFNGKDLTGWKALNPSVEMKWTVKDGVLRNDPPTTDIVSQRSFWNYKLHADFRIVEPVARSPLSHQESDVEFIALECFVRGSYFFSYRDNVDYSLHLLERKKPQGKAHHRGNPHFLMP